MRHEAKYARSQNIEASRCDQHGKIRYLSRKAAKRAAKRNHPGDNMDTFRCDENQNYWHIGHLSLRTIQGF